MHVAEVLSSERTVPAVVTIGVHLILAYLVAMSAGFVPKPAVFEHSVVVDVPKIKDEPVENKPLVVSQESVTNQPFKFIATVPDILIEKEIIVGRVPDGETKSDERPDGQGVSLPVTGARIVHKTEPPYPRYSRLNQEEGVVLLRITITATGTIGSVSVERSSGFARLDDAALKAIREWRFAPAMRGSQAIATTTTVPVRFRLD